MKDIKNVQTTIQQKLGGGYEVKEKSRCKNRMKIVGMNDYENHKRNN